MFAYIKGIITVKTPTYVVLENQGIGYQVFISLFTADKLSNLQECSLFIRTIARIENQNVTGYVLYGFAEEKEKDLFERLLSVSGVGANTAIVMLSTYRVEEIIQAILNGNIGMIKSIKGIGPKSAERIILELRDKFDKSAQFAINTSVSENTLKEEALMALTSLGFNKQAIIKVINQIMGSNPSISSVEELIKLSLKSL
jgi:Holliday junction DNA helicase RuvA